MAVPETAFEIGKVQVALVVKFSLNIAFLYETHLHF